MKRAAQRFINYIRSERGMTEKNGVIFHDNDFEVFIDPDGDNHQYYEFEMNALNTIWELTLPRPYRAGGEAVPGQAPHVLNTL